jgi:hypothetical protein
MTRRGCVILDRETEVLGGRHAGPFCHVFTCAQEFDDRQGQVGEAQRIGRSLLDEKRVGRHRIGVRRQPDPVRLGKMDDPVPLFRRAQTPRSCCDARVRQWLSRLSRGRPRRRWPPES